MESSKCESRGLKIFDMVDARPIKISVVTFLYVIVIFFVQEVL